MSNNCSHKKELPSYDKWRFTIYTTLVLIIVFNPWTFILMNKILSNLVGPICSKEGCPTLLGFFIHVIVFTLIIRYLMDLRI